MTREIDRKGWLGLVSAVAVGVVLVWTLGTVPGLITIVVLGGLVLIAVIARQLRQAVSTKESK